ncbi:MAG: TIGR00297 family protein [Synechococcaceae cyanobacterium]|nr:TIGR00297 family protein [Synechococcaceae cyanobacterium]
MVPLAAMPPEAVTAAAVTPEPVTSAVWPLAVLPPLLPLPAPGLSSWGVALAANLVLIALAQRAPVLTRAGWIHAGVLGTLLWGSLGPRGWLAVVAYLAAGSLVTRLGWRRKQEAGVAEARGGRRGPANVWGSALVGCGLGLLASVSPPGWQPVLLLGFAASFSAKLADTFGSEIGKRWGRTTLLITTLRPVPPGTEGAVSLEGTAASLLGGALMAAMMLGLGLLQGWGSWLLVTGVALLATLLESLIGATLQQRLPWLSNELVNGLQTAIAAVLAVALALASSRP